MTSFSTKGVTESGGKYIPYGIQEITITGVSAKEVGDGTSTPAIFVDFKELKGEKILNIRFAFSEKATKYSLRKIKHILTKVITPMEVEAFDGKDFKTVTEMATALNTVLSNRPLRVKFQAEEVASRDAGSRPWKKAILGFPPFAEALSVNPTQLVFDNAKDIKLLGATLTPTPQRQGVGDLPF